MDAGTMTNAVWGVLFFAVIVFVMIRRRSAGRRPDGSRRRAGGVGTAAAGTIYGFLTEDKQNAVDIIVEGQAEARRPEYPDGNLPDLEEPKG